MNKLGNSTLIKFKNYLKLKNYSDRTIECYSWVVLKFLESQDKSAMHLSSDDFTINQSPSYLLKNFDHRLFWVINNTIIDDENLELLKNKFL